MKISKKLNLSLIILFLLIFAIWAKSISTQEISSSKDYKETEFKHSISAKAYVSDGDTIKFGKERIRLLFIDTPETKQECFDKNGNQYKCGIMAKNFLIRFINNRIVTCKYNQRDIYNRYLAECFVDGISINKEMIRSGMAVFFSYQGFDPKLIELQESAKKQKLGIWQGEFELPQHYRKRTR